MNPRSAIASAVLVLVAASPAVAGTGKPARKYESTVAVQWFDFLYDLTKAEAINPPVASRRFAIAGVALYESIVAGAPELVSLAGQVNDLPVTPGPIDERHNWDLVAHGALGRVAEQLFSTASNGSKLAIRVMKAQLGARLARNVKPEILDRSLAYGVTVADAVLAWAATDGFATYNNCAFVPPVGPGLWEPTPPAFVANPLQPCWGQLRPFVIDSGADCPPPAPTTFSTDPVSQFYAEANEVYTTVNSLTAEQLTIANYWNDGGGVTGTPGGHWIALIGQLLEEGERDLTFAARAYASVGAAIADAFIQCWWVKFVYNLLRPVTYIQDNIDAAWLPVIPTPPFPEYSSGHSTQSGAATTVLASLFGPIGFTDRTHERHNPELSLAPRFYASFDDAGAEAALSRLYGGIHYRPANENGLAAGQCIGQTVVSSLQFTK